MNHSSVNTLSSVLHVCVKKNKTANVYFQADRSERETEIKEGGNGQS